MKCNIANVLQVFFILRLIAANLENLEKLEFWVNHGDFSEFFAKLGKVREFFCHFKWLKSHVSSYGYSSQYWVFFSQYAFILNKHSYICVLDCLLAWCSL